MHDREGGWGVEGVRPKTLPPEAAEDGAGWQGSPKSPGVIGDGWPWRNGKRGSSSLHSRAISYMEKGPPES